MSVDGCHLISTADTSDCLQDLERWDNFDLRKALIVSKYVTRTCCPSCVDNLKTFQPCGGSGYI